MNEKEMIEKMARLTCPNSKEWSCKACNWGAEPNCVDYKKAKTLYNANCRIIENGSVVLTDKEYNKLIERPLKAMGELTCSKIKEKKSKNENNY